MYLHQKVLWHYPGMISLKRGAVSPPVGEEPVKEFSAEVRVHIRGPPWSPSWPGMRVAETVGQRTFKKVPAILKGACIS